MKIFSCEQIRQIDAYTIKNEPITSTNLMERAANRLFQWIVKKYPVDICFQIFAGPGNNGGDGVALARMLAQKGYCVQLYILYSSYYSPDLEINIKRLKDLGKVTPFILDNDTFLPVIPDNSVVIDALFGSGLKRPLRGETARIVDHINSAKVDVIAIDIPSGLFGEENPCPNSNPVVKATTTLTLQFPKLSFLFPENDEFIGDWHIIDIGLNKQIIDDMKTPYHFTERDEVRGMLKKRAKYSHKGTYGHALIIAGSYGMLGASILSVKACLRTGVGLVTAHIPTIGYQIMQITVPEALVSIDGNEHYFTGVDNYKGYSAIAIGPGIGQHLQTVNGFKELLSIVDIPLVIDADGLNALAAKPEMFSSLPKGTILTPHVGEFNRLFTKQDSGYKRMRVAAEMAVLHGVVIVLKGAHTQIACPDGSIFFNSTGNTGMATGGAGDVLTGIIVSLLAQGYSPEESSLLGTYIHGFAADLGIQGSSVQSLIASDIIDFLGETFSKLTL